MACSISNNIDDEWLQFLMTTNKNKYNNEVGNESDSTSQIDYSNEDEEEYADADADAGADADTDCDGEETGRKVYTHTFKQAPEPGSLNVSTKSIIAYLKEPIDLNIFWNIPVIPYATPEEGVIKKTIKINSLSAEELIVVQERLKAEPYFEEQVISHIDNPNGRVPFKDTRKITCGISSKDIMTYHLKKKKEFYNCFVMIIRIQMDKDFKEFHVKVFNTGKLEIPGIQSDEQFIIILNKSIAFLQPYSTEKIEYNNKFDQILINSNFNCGFFIIRQMLYDILVKKYNIQAIYDSCSYPGILCKFYYNKDLDLQTGVQVVTKETRGNKKDKPKNIIKVSFMIFRTGSVLIVGRCEDKIVEEVYTFIKTLLITEFRFICDRLITNKEEGIKHKKPKTRKKVVYFEK
jgi:hypothetical protein